MTTIAPTTSRPSRAVASPPYTKIEFKTPEQTPAVKASLAEYNDRMAALYHLGRRFERASTEGLRRFADILHLLSDADIDRVARYAKGLAEWPEDG